MAKRIAEYHFGKVKNIGFKPAGKTNAVFEVKTSTGDYIIRIAPARARINGFIKEQWAIEKAKGVGIPTSEVLEVGNKIIDLPYMIQSKEKGNVAMDHPKRLEILKELGAYAKLIHTIPTEGFGNEFTGSKYKHFGKKTWPSFLVDELQVNEGLNYLAQQEILDRVKLKRLYSFFNRIRKWTIRPTLNHGDLRLKNVLVSDEGKIRAIIDWDNCSSNAAPYWDLSIALHDLSIDAKQSFLEGYELNTESFARLSYALTAFNLINYVPAIREIVRKKDHGKLELYRLRLNGNLDLFSL